MDFCKYKRDLNFSYTMGAFPTIELLNSAKYRTLSVLVHSKYDNIEKLRKICEYNKVNLIFNDKIINKLQTKENIFVIGVFEKKYCDLEKENHILLFEPRDKGNLGTILRTSLGFGFKNIGLVSNCDVFDPKTVRASMGAIFKLNIEIFDSIEKYYLKFKENKVYSFVLNENSTPLNSVNIQKPYTLLFGNESHGLENCNLNNTIPIFIKQSKEVDSFNLPIAIGIAMYKFTENE